MTLTFGTDGIRATMGTGFLTHEQLPRLGHAIARFITQRYTQPRILIAGDTRRSRSYITAVLASELSLMGCSIYDAGILPTPALYYLVHHAQQFDVGIIISASHNPHHDNGLKIIDKLTGKLSSADEKEIESLFEQPRQTTCYKKLGTIESYPQATALYEEFLRSFFNRDIFSGLRILLDTTHGATYEIAPRVLEALGAHVITVHNTPTGYNINESCGSTHPERLQEAVIAHNAHAGFAFDGDGDRIIAVNGNGEIKDGDDIIAFLMQHPDYTEQQGLVGTIMSNAALEAWLLSKGKVLIRSTVGDKNVVEHMHKNNMLLGAEPSGHCIVYDKLTTGDGILVALHLLQTMVLLNDFSLTTFNKYPQQHFAIKYTHKKELATPSLATAIKKAEQEVTPGRVIVRYSGTESYLRIMVEAPYEKLVQEIGTSLACYFFQELNS